MKIVSFEIPYKLHREGNGVVLELQEEGKKQLGEEQVKDQDATNIPNIAKELGDYNDKQKSIVKNTLMASEKQAEGKLILKYLV